MTNRLPGAGEAPAVTTWTFEPGQLRSHDESLKYEHTKHALEHELCSGPVPLGSPIRGVCSSLRASCPSINSGAATAAAAAIAAAPGPRRTLSSSDYISTGTTADVQLDAAAAAPAAAAAAAPMPAQRRSGLLDVLLAPMLPGADESKVLERLSQLRTALEEQLVAASQWEQQVRRVLRLTACCCSCLSNYHL